MTRPKPARARRRGKPSPWIAIAKDELEKELALYRIAALQKDERAACRLEGEISGLLRARRIWKRLVVKERELYGPWPKLGLLDDALRTEAARLRRGGRAK